MLLPKPGTRRAQIGRAALMLAVALTGGCSGAAPQATGTTPATPGAGSTAGPGAAAVFAGTLVPARGGTAWAVGVFSSATGRLLRVLTEPSAGTADMVLGVHNGSVYFTVLRGAGAPSVWRVPLTGGQAVLVHAGATDYALSPDGRVAAYVTTADAGQTTELVVSNAVTGQHRTIVRVSYPPGVTPLGLTNLAWAPDDTHLAVEAVYAAFASDVLVFNARTARTLSDGLKVPCPDACAAKMPSYLHSGTLTYVAEQLALNSSAITLVSWAGGHLAKLVTMWAGPGSPPIVQGESTAPQGTAIWVLASQTWTAGRFTVRDTIGRWSGGPPVTVRTLPPAIVTQPPSGIA
jgi:hypothetical protein